jgi:hypothetical protein
MRGLYTLCAATSALGNTFMCWNIADNIVDTSFQDTSFQKYQRRVLNFELNFALKVSAIGLGLVSGLAFPITTPALYYYNKSLIKSLIDEEMKRINEEK